MIRNRLAEIMFERGIKTVRMAKEIGISRNTIANTAANTSEMLQMKTIDKICRYLNITPGEFFEYMPVDIDFKLYESSPIIMILDSSTDIYDVSITLDLLIDINNDGKRINLDTELFLEEETELSMVPFDPNELKFKIAFENSKDAEDIANLFSSFSRGFKKVIHNNLSNEIKKFLLLYLKENKDSTQEYDVIENADIVIKNDFFYGRFE